MGRDGHEDAQIQAQGQERRGTALDGWPVNSQQMHERLEELAPVLQGTNPDCKDYPVRRDKFIHAEYWEKESVAEEIWVFIAAREGGPTEEEVEEIVWREVTYLEGIARPNPFRKH